MNGKRTTSRRRDYILPTKPHIYWSRGMWRVLPASRAPFGVRPEWFRAANLQASKLVVKLNREALRNVLPQV